jgi:hypothetical protein
LPAFRSVLKATLSVSELRILGQDSQLEKGGQRDFVDRAELLSSARRTHFFPTVL